MLLAHAWREGPYCPDLPRIATFSAGEMEVRFLFCRRFAESRRPFFYWKRLLALATSTGIIAVDKNRTGFCLQS
jgi:hypothetical protein